MDPKELNRSALKDISGGVVENGKIVFRNICTECGKGWEYSVEEGTSAIPNWATGPWCPECRKKQRIKLSEKANQTSDSDK